MFKKTVLAVAVASISVWSVPASATWWGGSSSSSGGYCKKNCGGSTSSSSSTSSSTSTSTSTSSSSTGGTTSGTQVPEPGMLGMFGLGLAGLAFARRRRQTGRKLA